MIAPALLSRTAILLSNLRIGGGPMAIRVRVSSKHQIAVPASVRKQLQIEGGDHLLVEVREGHVVLVPEPRDFAAHLRGLHRVIWQGVDPDEYVRRERDAWQD